MLLESNADFSDAESPCANEMDVAPWCFRWVGWDGYIWVVGDKEHLGADKQVLKNMS